MGIIVKSLGTAIGLATEAIASHKQKKQAQVNVVEVNSSKDHLSSSRQEVDDSSDSDDEADAADWALDDAAAELEDSKALPPTYEASEGDVKEEPVKSVDEVITHFKEEHPAVLAVHNSEEVPLPCPVILPQRRPRAKKRGFVRAYAPILGECKGIDQESFMAFLNDFDEASKSSPAIDVVNLAAMVVGFIPGPITMGVGIAVQFIAGTTKEIQTRYRTNAYLNQINETLFMPHGLYCMVMTYKPDQPGQRVIEINANEAITKNVTTALNVPDNEMRAKLKNIKLSSGKTEGELNLPESAPLVYPGLDTAADNVTQPLDAKKQNKLKSSGAFLQDYLDRRSQARYAQYNPNTKFARMPEQKFSSRFADPNHPVNNGGLITFLTGGTVDLGSRKRERRVRKKERQAARRGITLSDEEKRAIYYGQHRKKTVLGMVKRALTPDVLYLMIVNLPTEEEMALAREQIAAAKEAAKEAKRHVQSPY